MKSSCRRISSIFVAYSAVLVLLPAVALPPAVAQTGTGASFSAAWQVVDNLADDKFEAVLTLRNGTDELLVPPWSLNFNSPAELDPQSVAAPYALRRVEGDLWAICATRECPALGPGQECRLSYRGAPCAINISDAPDGLYLVTTDAAGAEQRPIVVPLTSRLFPAGAKLHRGAADRVPVATPAARFAANESLELLPADKLPVVIPTPVAAARLAGTAVIDAATKIEYDAALANEAQLLADWLREKFGLSLQLRAGTSGPGNSIRLKMDNVIVAAKARQSGDEAYVLTVKDGTGIEIVGSDPAGVFYGVQTLRGLVPLAAYRAQGQPLAIPAVQIEDVPRFAYRGLMLDVARNFQSVETVKQLLDRMACYKLNRFHWHLSDDEGWRVEIKALPELTAFGGRRGHSAGATEFLTPSYGSGPFPGAKGSLGSGYYTQEEFIDVLRYAQARHITVVPEFDFPGHSRAAVRAMAARAERQGTDPDFRLTDPGDTSRYASVQGWTANVLDVGRESTYRFLDTVFGEVAGMYERAGVPLAMLHLGTDEVPSGAWEQSPACRAIATDKEGRARGLALELYFLKRACALVAQHGAAPACWSDCVLTAVDDPDWPVRPTVFVWNTFWGRSREEAGYRLANAGFDVVLSSATDLYFDMAHEKDPQEPGYYWASFTDTYEVFAFNPFDTLQSAAIDLLGRPLDAAKFAGATQLTAAGRAHLRGIQGQLWGETIRSPERLDYMAFPRTIALAERAWAAEPEFTGLADAASRAMARDAAWNVFVNALGQREMPRLGLENPAMNYRVPPPGVIERDGKLEANVALPGLAIHYTTDGSEPTAASPRYERTIPATPKAVFRAFDASGHASRAIHPRQSSSADALE